MIGAVRDAASAIGGRTGSVEVAMVLGSGLGGYANRIESATVIPYSEIPGMPQSTVAGHAGNLVLGEQAGWRVALLQGRAHLYEGRTAHEVAFGVRLMASLGARTLVVTNAAGGIAPSLRPGDLMAITDHLNLTGTSSLTGPHDPSAGERFVDMSEAYDRSLVALAENAATDLGFELRRGVYAGLAGPAYETPAEVRMLATLGADAVGMSTVLEVLAARQLGMRVLGLSCISNAAAGLSDGPLSHTEVQEMGARVKDRFEALLSAVLQAMAEQGG